MVEYAAIMIGALGLMFFLFEVGFRLSTPGFIENDLMDLMDFIKLGFFFMAFAMGFYVVGLMNIIAGENNASTNFTRFVALSIWLWGTFFFMTAIGFLIYFIWWIPKKVKEAEKKSKSSAEAAL